MKRVTLDLGADMVSPRSLAHPPTRSTCAESERAAAATLEEVPEFVKSSAYEVVNMSDWGYVEMKKLKRTGDMQEPCGTPVLI